VAECMVARHPDLWLYDGAVAYLADLLARYPNITEISRQIIERERADMVGLLTGLNDRMNWLRGYLSATGGDTQAAYEYQEVIQRMHEHDGAVQALNKLIRHIDFIPYELKLEHSVK